ncbi:MAG: hypothetical protein HRU18_18250 [Pseudoalteromonas sp.]|uniref:hypothetical protein n=1 Tax=Pseudoalteromonas sp. TaxID=53249 RepID=UPI001D6F4FAD|nr:hypothetical protein [Pseudoalteromonas sp.]NRA80146.1 hypothetical protein [Pseudoalteromonas sp.]
MTQEKAKKPGRPKTFKVAQSGKISNGEGGFYEKGDALPNGCDIESLKAKGLVE